MASQTISKKNSNADVSDYIVQDHIKLQSDYIDRKQKKADDYYAEAVKASLLSRKSSAQTQSDFEPHR